jgi:hypothetical protein
MMGTATAALTDVIRESAARRASLVAAAANTGAAALGLLMAGLFAQYLPQPTVLVFEVLLGLLAAAALALAFVPKTVTRRERPSLRFAGLAIPVIGVGVAADHFGNFRAVLGCSIVLALLCGLAAAGISGGNRAGRPRASGSA